MHSKLPIYFARICCGKELDIDILPEQASLSNYCATLAHKVNNEFIDTFKCIMVLPTFNSRHAIHLTSMLILNLCGIQDLVR